MKDPEILILLQNRDESALRVITENYGALCRQVAMQILGNAQDAEECMNDALLKIWCSIPPAKPEYLRAYFVATVRNLALDRAEAQHTLKRGGDQMPLVLDELAEIAADGQDITAETELRELWDIIRAFLRKQPEKSRRLFMQRYYYMMPTGEIAAENGVSENSVTVTLHRLRKKLQTILRKEQYL